MVNRPVFRKLEEGDRNMTVSEAAKYLGISERTLRGWILLKKIRVSRILGGAVRIRKSTADEVLAGVETPPEELLKKRPRGVKTLKASSSVTEVA